MSAHMTKTWFVDGQIIEQEIPEDEFYEREWVGLTDEETEAIVDAHTSDDGQGYDIWCDGRGVADDVAAKLRGLNT